MDDEMALAKEWFGSKVRLCQLRTGTVDQPDPEKGLLDALFSSFSLPAYQRSSVLNSLEVYTQALRQAGRGSIAGAMSIAEPSPAGGINRFAHLLAGDILQSARGQWETALTEASQPRGSRVGPPSDDLTCGTDPPKMGLREGLNCRTAGGTEGLSCTVLNMTLEEATGERASQRPRHRSKSAPDPTGQVLREKPVQVLGGWRTGCRLDQGLLSCCGVQQGESDMEAHMDLCDGRVSHHQSNCRPRHSSKELPPCWFSGCAGGQEGKMEDMSGQKCFPRKCSQDYPDAPPTTPLLPEMVRIHGSFHRKLKGSLAKEFLPSPPPPTPRYLPGIADEERLGLRNDRAEFVARLMRSLSLECSKRGVLGVEEDWTDGAHSAEGGPQEMPRLLAYASQLSAKIINSATTSYAAHDEAQVPRTDPGKWLQLTAEQWANEVMAASFLELMNEETVGHNLEDIAPPQSSPALKSPSQRSYQVPHASCTEDLSSFTGQLIANILMQALAELGTPNLRQFLVQEMAEELSNSIVAEAVTTATWHKSPSWRKPESPEWSCNPSNDTLRVMARLSPQPGAIEPSYAAFPVEAMAQGAVRLDMGLTGASSDQELRLGNPKGSEVRAFLDKSVCLGVQELQGMLLWVTASNLGIPTLQLVVQDVQLQTEFSMLADRARQVGWTVGDLMISLWQYCELEDNLAGSGHNLNDTSLLKYLWMKLVEKEIEE